MFHSLSSGILVTLCFVLCTALVVIAERFAMPYAVWLEAGRTRAAKTGETKPSFAVWLYRLLMIALVFLFFFAISWRPIYSTHAAVTTFVVVTAISRAKFTFIREPLVFSDAVFLLDVFKHKTLFYTNYLGGFFIICALAYVIGTSSIYMILEPHLLPTGDQLLWIMLGVAAAVIPWMILLSPMSHWMNREWSSQLLDVYDAKETTRRFGALSAVTLQFIVWLRHRGVDQVAKRTQSKSNRGLVPKKQKGSAPLIVIWQSESFFDLRHVGVVDIKLPNLDRLRKQSVQWGRLANVFEGGYTLRTEFAVLSGLQPNQLSVDASHPYLWVDGYANGTWTKQLQQAGWHTHFIHPYERAFFHRDKAIPAIGFSHMTMLDDFDFDAERDGPYVSDSALSARVCEIAQSVSLNQPALLFVASMGNHGPWGAGRGIESTQQVEVYSHLLQEADRALGKLCEELDALGRPVWLGFYGDHAPLLKSLADPFPDPRTEYLIVPAAQAQVRIKVSSQPQAAEPWTLFERILDHAGLLEVQHERS